MFPVPITNQTLELIDCRDAWFFDEKYNCWCLEDVLYTEKTTTPRFQRLSIFVPKAYMRAPGVIDERGSDGMYSAGTAPVIFENNSAGYMQMPHTWLGGPRDEASKYIERGMIYVTCGCRGRESRDQSGKLCAKSPWSLVDLKTAIRFLRHNRAVLPGDMSKMISVGWSAGGAMSTLLGVTGDNENYLAFLQENGAFMDESDAVYAAQIYCPIVDLEHADLAYEWQFRNDPENESSPTAPAGVMDDFRKALSGKLAAAYVEYFNSLGLKNPKTGESLRFNADGRSGSAYDYLMRTLEASAAEYLSRLDAGKLPQPYNSADYIAGNYIRKVPAPMSGPGGASGKVDFNPPPDNGSHGPMGDKPAEPPCLGDLLSRPPKGVPYEEPELRMVDASGTNKEAWLKWDGKKAAITSLDDYILHHRRRMKPCPSFDTLGMDSAENQEFGTAERDYMHFNTVIPAAMEELKAQFPKEYARYHDAYAAAIGDKELARRVYLINPFHFIGTAEQSTQAAHYRIRVGACDADTAFTVSMTLALKLAADEKDTDYSFVWDLPHCEADFPGEVCDWVESIC